MLKQVRVSLSKNADDFEEIVKKWQKEAYAYYDSVNLVADAEDIVNFIVDQWEEVNGIKINETEIKRIEGIVGIENSDDDNESIGDDEIEHLKDIMKASGKEFTIESAVTFLKKELGDVTITKVPTDAAYLFVFPTHDKFYTEAQVIAEAKLVQKDIELDTEASTKEIIQKTAEELVSEGFDVVGLKNKKFALQAHDGNTYVFEKEANDLLEFKLKGVKKQAEINIDKEINQVILKTISDLVSASKRMNALNTKIVKEIKSETDSMKKDRLNTLAEKLSKETSNIINTMETIHGLKEKQGF